MPPRFNGTESEDADAWMSHFNHYCVYKEHNDDKALALFKVLMSGNAALWLDALPHDAVATLNAVKHKTDSY